MPPKSGRGRGRGRGRGGRGSRGGRGGRGGVSIFAATSNPINGISRGRGGRGRGRGRGKSIDPRIEALKVRKAEIQSQYRNVFGIQKEALIELGDKSLAAITQDPSYHETLPEFEIVTNRLKRRYMETVAEAEIDFQMRKRLALDHDRQNRHLINQQYLLKIQEEKEESVAELKERVLYTLHLHRSGKNYTDRKTLLKVIEDGVAFQYGEDGREVIDAFRPKRWVHSTATPYQVQPLSSWSSDTMKTSKTTTIGDNEYEQHPTNWWASLTTKEKKNYTNAQEKIIRDKNAGKKSAPRRKATGNALFKVQSSAADAEDEDDDDDEDQEATKPAIVSAPVDSGMPDSQVDAPEYPKDEYGVNVPRKIPARNSKKPIMNRMVTPACVEFEDLEGDVDEVGNPGIEEIGIRKVFYKGKTEEIIGKDVRPNPKHIYLNQAIHEFNSALNQPGDLDEDLVEAYALHPKFGIALPASTNSAFNDKTGSWEEPTDFSQPLERSKPTIMFEELSTGQKKLYRNVRSWDIQVGEDFHSLPIRNKMLEMLSHEKDNGWEPSKVPSQTTMDGYEGKILPELIDAVSTDKMQEGRRKEVSPTPSAPATPKTPILHPLPVQVPPKPSPLRRIPPTQPQPQPQPQIQTPVPPPLAPAPSRPPVIRQSYDPVRDLYMQVDHTQYTRPQPPIAILPFGQPDRLTALAQMASDDSQASAARQMSAALRRESITGNAVQVINTEYSVPPPAPAPVVAYRWSPPQASAMPPPPPIRPAPYFPPQTQQPLIHPSPQPPQPVQAPHTPQAPQVPQQWGPAQMHTFSMQQQPPFPPSLQHISPRSVLPATGGTRHRALAPAPQRNPQPPTYPQPWNYPPQSNGYSQ